jgi:hypothetical protein
VRTWTYPSQTGLGEYIVTHTDNGLLACNCRGWVLTKRGQIHECRHLRDVVETEHLTVVVRGRYLFANPRLTPRPQDDTLIVGEMTMTMATMATILEPMKASAMVEGRFPHLLTEDGYIIPERFDAAFATGEWVMDEKLDGHRCLTRKADSTITTPLRSVQLPAHIVAVLKQLPDGVYDGELLVPGGVSTDVPSLASRSQLIYALFDVLECQGQSTLAMTQAQRREVLEMCLQFAPGQDAVVMVAQSVPSWQTVKAIWAKGGEGVIIKRLSGTYRCGYRSQDWLKIKKLQHATVTVTGFETGSFGPTAVVLFKQNNGVEGRCKNQDVAATAANPAAYIGRKLVVQYQQQMRGSKSLRHPMFDHWAGDAE